MTDVAVMRAFESRALDRPDFYFTGDDCRYRFEAEAKQRFLGFLRDGFDSGVRYKNRTLKWNTAIEQKAFEFGRYLLGRADDLDFSEPSPSLKRTDDLELRSRILSLSQSVARRLGIGESTVHYLRANARDYYPLKVYQRVRKKLQNSACAPVQRMT